MLLQKSHVVYKFTCNHGDGTPCASYISMTQTKLSRRLTCHLQNVAPTTHFREKHQKHLKREDLEKGTTILTQESDSRKLQILEALLIMKEKPSMNIQAGEFQVPSTRIMRGELPGDRL